MKKCSWVKKSLLICLAMAGTTIGACSTAKDKNESLQISDTKTELQPHELGLGWNLGNQLDAYRNSIAEETAWGNKPATQATFNAIKSAGFSSVRIPVTWLGKIGASPDYKLDNEWLNRVAELVNYAEKAGLKAVINIHHDGGHWLDIKKAATDPLFNKALKEQLKAVWTQIAQKFADKDDFLFFESMNEIHDGGWGWGDNRKDNGKQYQTFNEWQQVFVDAVRATGGNNASRWLGIPTYCTNIDLAEHFLLPKDPAKHLLIAVHSYEPYEYCLEDKYSEWGHTGATDKKHPTSDEQALVNELDKAKALHEKFGAPVYIGEFGAVHRSSEREETFRKYYLEYYCKAAADRGISVIYWDNGSAGVGRECSGLLDHGSGTWLNNGDEIVNTMTKGYFTTNKNYTLQSVYDNAPKH